MTANSLAQPLNATLRTSELDALSAMNLLYHVTCMMSAEDTQRHSSLMATMHFTWHLST